jgi:transposase
VQIEQKNDAADVEAICEAVTRPNMRFVPVETGAQQSVLVLHRSRDLLMRQRTMILNAIRAHLAEFGSITAQGPSKVVELVTELRDSETPKVPEVARVGLLALAAQLDSLATAIRDIERQLLAWHRHNPASQRLETIPGVGIITATALAASVPDPFVFKSGRQFAAFLGLVPPTELVWRQGPPGAYLEDGERLPEEIAGRRRHLRDPKGADRVGRAGASRELPSRRCGFNRSRTRQPTAADKECKGRRE